MSNKRHPQDNHKADNSRHPNCPRESYDNLSDVLLNHIGLRLMIEQKVGEASKEVGKEFKLYGGFVLAAIALVGIFGIKPLAEWYKQYIEEKVTEKYVSDAVQNQLNQFSTDTIQPLLDRRITKAKQEINALYDHKMIVLNNKAQQLDHKMTILNENAQQFNHRMSALNVKALQIESATQIINEKIELVKTLLSATSGRRKDYDRLRNVAKGTNELAQIAADSLNLLNETYENQKRRMSDFNRLTLDYKIDGKKLTPHSDFLVNIIHSDLPINCEGAINDLAEKKKKCNVPTLIFAMRNTKYLRCMFAAIRGLEKTTGMQFPALGTDAVESWWNNNSTNLLYRSVLEEAITATPMPNESETESCKRVISLLDEDIKANQSHGHSAARMIELLLHLMQDKSNEQYCKEFFERALKACEKDEALHNTSFAYKAIYIYKYKTGEFVDYINKRLKEHPGFETELRQLNYFNNTFFSDYKKFNWPSHLLCTKPSSSKPDQK